jgi:hypothetical protein
MKTFIKWHIFSLVKFLLCFLFKKRIYVLLKILENDKILFFCISYKIELRFVHVFNLVYVVGNIIKWKWNCNIWWNLKYWWKYVVFQLFNLILMLQTKIYIVLKKTAPTDPTKTAFVWFGLIQILFLKSTEPNQTAYFFMLRFRWLLPSKPTKLHREHP